MEENSSELLELRIKSKAIASRAEQVRLLMLRDRCGTHHAHAHALEGEHQRKSTQTGRNYYKVMSQPSYTPPWTTGVVLWRFERVRTTHLDDALLSVGR